jgi:hypothetical protein
MLIPGGRVFLILYRSLEIHAILEISEGVQGASCVNIWVKSIPKEKKQQG